MKKTTKHYGQLGSGRSLNCTTIRFITVSPALEAVLPGGKVHEAAGAVPVTGLVGLVLGALHATTGATVVVTATVWYMLRNFRRILVVQC